MREPVTVRCERGSSVVGNDGSDDNHIFHLYSREKNARSELWDGARSGTQAALDVFNADEVRIYSLEFDVSYVHNVDA